MNPVDPAEQQPVKIMKPKLPKQMEPLVLSEQSIDDECSFTQASCQDDRIADVSARKVKFDQVLFRGVTFEQAVLPQAEWMDVVFEHCDLSNADFSESTLYRVQFHHCKLIGIDFTAATLRNVVFQQCAADYATFRFSNMKQVSFQSTSLLKSDFYHTELFKTEFPGCSIDQAQFSGTKLAGIDLSRTEFHQLGATQEDLQGCIISPHQAIPLARMLGLVVKE